MSKEVKLSLLVAVVLAVIGFIVYRALPRYSPRKSTQSFSSENVTVSSLDVSKSADFLPAGIPLDRSAITEQNKLDYPDKGVTLYSVSYRSAIQPEALYATYLKYFTDQKYTINQSTKTAISMTFETTKGADNVSVTITINKGYSLVSLAVLHHH